MDAQQPLAAELEHPLYVVASVGGADVQSDLAAEAPKAKAGLVVHDCEVTTGAGDGATGWGAGAASVWSVPLGAAWLTRCWPVWRPADAALVPLPSTGSCPETICANTATQSTAKTATEIRTARRRNWPSRRRRARRRSRATRLLSSGVTGPAWAGQRNAR